MARSVFVLLHRWAGLTIAAFLLVAGLTGAVISWDHELDDWLNPHLHTVESRGAAIPALDLARQFEARDPRARVAYLPLAAEAGESLSLFVMPRVDAATGGLHKLGYNQVFLDPVTGAELGRREWGQVWPITRETLISFLYNRCTTPCTCRRCGARSAGASGCSGSSPSSGCSIPSSAST
ncbi:UNVERIFIED_ORG: putative iron-regulated membrane protein [Methylobacterium sp. SuP10 SLI 274]|nr:putative iron-regulated membrane protein [Methylobacterium sp. SuP10 SLI 274]